MLLRSQVLDPLRIIRPVYGLGVLRPRHDKAPIVPVGRGRQEEPFQMRLTVLVVGPQEAEVPDREQLRFRVMKLRVDAAVQRSRGAGAVSVGRSHGAGSKNIRPRKGAERRGKGQPDKGDRKSRRQRQTAGECPWTG